MMRATRVLMLCAGLVAVGVSVATAQRPSQRVDILVQRYMDQRDTGKYDEALQTALKASRLRPNDSYVWGFVGEGYLNKDMWVEAIEAFRKALELGSQDPVDREQLARALVSEGWQRHENGDDADAERLLREAEDRDPNNADAPNDLGVVLRYQQRHGEARRQFEKAMKLAPDSAWPHNNLGTVFQDLGEMEEAAQKYRDALDLDADYATARSNLVWVLLALEEFQEAEQHCRVLLDKGGPPAQTHYNLGRALAGQGSFDEAEEAYKDALKAAPEYWDAQWALDGLADAMVNYSQKVAKTRNLEAAIAFCRKAHGRDPSNDDALTWLAAYLRLQSPGSDTRALEAKATELVNEQAAAVLGALISMVRAGQLPDGTLVAAELLRGQDNLRELARWLTRAGDSGASDEDAMGMALIGAVASADALLIGLEHGPSADAISGAQYLLSNDLGASAPLDGEITNWLDNDFSGDTELDPERVPEVLCFPLTDNKGAELLAADASELVLSVTTREYGGVSLNWHLPVVEADLAKQAGLKLNPEEKRRYAFLASQGVIDCARRAFVMRWTPEALLGMADEDEQAEMRRIAEGYVVAMFNVEGIAAEDLLWRVCLVGTDRSQQFGVWADDLLPQPEYEAPPPEEAPAEEPPPGPGGPPGVEEAPAEEGEAVEEAPPSRVALLAFPLLTEKGQNVLSDDDGTIRFALLGLDGDTVQAVWEFPRRMQDVHIEQ